MKVMKRFQTEEEFEAWKNSPQYMTPYTVAITSTGAVHMYDGDDDDYSITFVARRHGWVRLWSPSIYKIGVDGLGFNPKVYVNGIEVLPDDNRWEGRYHYRAFIKKDSDYNPIIDDYGVEYGFEHIVKHVDNYDNDYGILQDRRHVFLNKRHSPKRYLFLSQGDICKITVDRPTILLYKIGGEDSGNNVLLPPQKRHIFNIVDVLKYAEYSKEIILGDGWDKIPVMTRVRKLFCGKNIKQNTRVADFMGKDENKSKIFSRKNLFFGLYPGFLKNIYNDIY